MCYDSRIMKFSIEKRLKGLAGEDKNRLGRVGVIETPHGSIETPAFIVVGTKATVKALSADDIAEHVGAHAVLANTYHLYLQPGYELIKRAGGLGKFMNWKGPTFTDSGGFQVFSLGAAFNAGGARKGGVSKIGQRGANSTAHLAPELQIANAAAVSTLSASGATVDLARPDHRSDDEPSQHEALAKIDEEGVTFKSVLDGSTHRFTPERSIEIQHGIGADIIFVFDECTSPLASYEYQRAAMDRTHRWAQRCLDFHQEAEAKKVADGILPQALFGIVQGGRYEDLRKESAQIIGSMTTTAGDGTERGFDGFGIGGSFDKEDMYTTVGWVNEVLPEGKPRHLLGIGEPADFFGGIENGADTFDCVMPTRMARNGTLYTSTGKIHIKNEKYTDRLGPIDMDETGKSLCDCYMCANYTAAYVAHLFRANEMLAGTLASIHNLYFIVNLVRKIRQSILDDRFDEYKQEFFSKYKSPGSTE
ncbi:MAG: queuine tRNA-ribosyltransferase queuine tRNA-ribosyltransferase [Candidatus Taylorbacteria bacterium]|nr:queuine tRNA-ribosyltransferase queuine tRNA-ribosyltransferase [Candidatus Taylorbacteria bacterium]